MRYQWIHLMDQEMWAQNLDKGAILFAQGIPPHSTVHLQMLAWPVPMKMNVLGVQNVEPATVTSMSMMWMHQYSIRQQDM